LSYGIELYGGGSYGGANFQVVAQIPPDGSIGIVRIPVISFTLSSQSGNVILSSISLTLNGISFITGGNFTSNAVGTIDPTDPINVKITAITLHAFSPLAIVIVVVDAINVSNEHPVLGQTWQFTVDNTIFNFTNYVVRGFERVLKLG
jgi:hypothetical protein